MIPRIEFRYSWIYDERHRGKPLIKKQLEIDNKKYPSSKEIINYKKKIESLWKKQGNKILTEISKLTKYNWKEKEIICYIVGVTRCFSDPLTMCLIKDKSRFINLLTHELIHRIQTKNPEKNKKWKNSLEKKYSQESKTTKNHIIVHAAHCNIYLKRSDKKGLNKDIESAQKYPDYKRAWEIVLEETPEAILKKFYEVTK